MVSQIANQEQFHSSISSGVTFVDFHAAWCGPCRMIAPVLEKLDPIYPNIDFYEVDIEEVPEITTEYEVTAVPMFILFKDGKVEDVIKGAAPAIIKQTLEKYK